MDPNIDLKKILELHAKWAIVEAGGIRADLQGAILREADLRGADLLGADLLGAIGADQALASASHLPATGPLHGWKKCRDEAIVKLLIPDGAMRSHGAGRKCRASEAVVLAIYNSDGEPIGETFSAHDPSFVYRVGETVTPREPWCEDRWRECASGIHFFITREEAEAYN